MNAFTTINSLQRKRRLPGSPTSLLLYTILPTILPAMPLPWSSAGESWLPSLMTISFLNRCCNTRFKFISCRCPTMKLLQATLIFITLSSIPPPTYLTPRAATESGIHAAEWQRPGVASCNCILLPCLNAPSPSHARQPFTMHFYCS